MPVPSLPFEMLAPDFADVVPARFAAYRPLLTDALRFFVGRLPQLRVSELLTAQLALSAEAGAAQRLVALMRECPSLHKLGQVVARDRRLAPELRTRLQALESLPASASMREVLPRIRRELGARVGEVEIGRRALAEASVSVVVPFRWRMAPDDVSAEGVFKVLRPGIEARLEEELVVWPALGDFLERRAAELDLPPLGYRDALDTVAELLASELHPEREQAHLAAAGQRYGGVPGIHVPRLLPLCTAHITAMERVDGVKVTEAAQPPAVRRRLAATLVDALVARPFWSDAPDTVFHADPHAGNLLVGADERIAVLDWGLVTTLGKAQREAVVQLVLAALAQDEAGVCRALAALGRPGRPGRREAALRETVGAALRELRHGALPGFAWTQALLDRLAGQGTVSFGHELLLMRKATLTLMAVAEDVAPGFSPDAVLVGTALTQFVREAPARLGAGFESRAFGCHLSSADLLGLWLDAPAAAMRYWSGLWRDGLDVLGGSP